METEDNKWYCAVKFFGRAEGYPANMDVCQILSSLEENRSSFEAYFASREMYDLWKEKEIEYYSKHPLTAKKYPKLDLTTRLQLRNEMMERKFKEKKQ